MQRAYNFAAGPAMLPETVLAKIQQEIFDWRGSGVSVMEIGHRTAMFQEFLQQIQNKLRQIMAIPDNYKILFLAGGAQGQFASIPLNLCGHNQAVDYFATGIWSQRALGYARNCAQVNIVTEVAANGAIAAPEQWQLNSKAAYAYYCPNETINGVQFASVPEVGEVPLVADMTSSIVSSVIDVSKFALIFASAQKNLGISGITLVIIRDDLLEQAQPNLATLWSYKQQVLQNSCVNTLPVFPVYVLDLMLDWLLEQGGVAQIELANRAKAAALYSYIDQSDFYSNSVVASSRSLLNIPFNLPSSELLQQFLQQAEQVGLKYLQGHAIVGGARASIYNAMPQAGVDKLLQFMQQFATQN